MSPSNWRSLLSEARTFLQKSRAPPIEGCCVTAIRPRVCLGPTKSVQASDVSSLKEGRHEVETLGVPGSIHVCIVAKRAIKQALDFFQAQTCDPCCPPLAQKVLFSHLTHCYVWCMQVPQIRPVLMCMPKDAMQSTKTTRISMMCQPRPALPTLCMLSFTSSPERGPSERNGLGLRSGVEAHGRQDMFDCGSVSWPTRVG